MDGELFCKIVQGEEGIAGVETFLVLPVATLHFAVMLGCAGTNQLVADTEADGGALKKRGQVLPAVGDAVGELKTVVYLDALQPDTPSGVPFHQLFQKIS